MAMIAILTLMEIILPWSMRVFLDNQVDQKNYAEICSGIAFFAAMLLIQVFINIQRFAALDRFGGRYIEYLTLSLEDKVQ